MLATTAALDWLRNQSVGSIVFLVFVGYISWVAQAAIANTFFHPLSRFPGPRLAAITTYRKAFIEIVLAKSWHLELERLHQKYGPIVRVGPNDLHFSSPQAYLDIYNAANRWDKEETLYHSFGEDESSFGYLDYKTAKERKDVLNRSFSASAVASAEGLVLDKIDSLCEVFVKLAKEGKPADLNWAFRCMTMDIITFMCFGNSVDAIHAPDFKSPIIVAMDACLPAFIIFKHSSFYKGMITGCPPNLSKKLSPPTAGLVDLQLILQGQIKEIVADPSTLKKLPHNMTIYHSLLDNKNGSSSSAQSLYDEAQALMFAGADTVGNTLMVAVYYMLKKTYVLKALKRELEAAWPDLSKPCPSFRELERLPFLTAVTKEALRMNSGVISGLPRVVPATGATIAGEEIPGGTIVSVGSTFVHYDAEVFPEPHTFKPERWLAPDARALDAYLVAFSKGPRSCLGINLAWYELRYTLATVIRKFNFELDPSSPERLSFRECFLPDYGHHHSFAKLSLATA